MRLDNILMLCYDSLQLVILINAQTELCPHQKVKRAGGCCEPVRKMLRQSPSRAERPNKTVRRSGRPVTGYKLD